MGTRRYSGYYFLVTFYHETLYGGGILNVIVRVPVCVHMCALVTQLCSTLCDPIGCSLPGFSVHGTLQVRILEWVAIPY